MKRPILATALALVITPPILASAGDWFAASGFTVMESIGSPPLGYALIGTDESGLFRILTAGDSYKGRFTVKAIGSEQVKVVDSEGAPRVALILHRNLPADLLLAAVAAVVQKSVVIAGSSTEPLTATPDLVTNPARLAEVCKASGLDLRAQHDWLLAGQRSLPQKITLPAAADDEPQTSLDIVRGSLPQVVASLARKGWSIVPRAPAGAPAVPAMPVTIRVKDASLSTVAAYLEAVTGVPLSVKAPPTAGKTGPGPAVDANRQKALYDEAVRLIRARRLKEALAKAKVLVKASPQARHYDLLGVILWKGGRHDLAIRAWRKALSIDPADTRARRYLIRAAQARPASPARRRG